MGRAFPTIVLTLIAACLLVLSVKQPVWRMRLEAPQYKDEDALSVKVYPNAMRGDIQEIKVLNSYIGVHIPETLPQTKWLPYLLVCGGVAGLLCSFLPRRRRKTALVITPVLVCLGLLAAAAQAQWQMREIGTKRDEKTKLVGVENFTAPLIGRTKIAQFTITSFLGWGSLTISAALALQLLAAWLNREGLKNSSGDEPPPGPDRGLATNIQ